MQWRLRLFLYPSPRERAGVRVIPQGQRKPEQVGWEKRSGSHRKDFTLEERWEPPQRLKNTFQNPSISYSHPTFTLSSGEGRGEGCPAGQRKPEQVGWEKRSGSHRKEQSPLSLGEGRGEGCHCAWAFQRGRFWGEIWCCRTENPTCSKKRQKYIYVDCVTRNFCK